ncbi:MAG: hypothetical protein ROO71_14980 [Balneola sp.]
MKSNHKKYIAEGTLIIFSVLFALFINKLFDDYQTNQKKVTALESIEQELLRNQAILQNWKEKHIGVRDRISSILEGESDSLKAELRKYDYLNLGVLTNNESLIDAILINTAWESAKSTGIVSEFDFETTQKLTLAYSMQEVLTERTLAKILDYYFDTSSHDMENLEPILIQFQLRFWELTGQEELMVTVYEDALEQFNR